MTTAAKRGLPLKTGKPGEFATKFSDLYTSWRRGKTTDDNSYLGGIAKCMLMPVIHLYTAFFAGYTLSAL